MFDRIRVLESKRMTTPAISCPICKSLDPSDYVLLARAPKWEVIKCRAHGVEFANEMPPPIDNTRANAILQLFYGTDATASSPRYVDFVDRVEKVTESRGVLHDVGCGGGQVLAEAERRGWQVQGNDVVDGVDVAMAAQGFTYFHGSLSGANIPDSSCDIVTSFCVLPHHLVDPLPDLHAVQKMLKSGGWFILELPDNGPYRKIARWLYKGSRGRVNQLIPQMYQPGGHQFGFNRKNLSMLLQSVGFEVVRIDDYFLDPHETVKRFTLRPFWYRGVMTTIVFAVQGMSRLLKQPNHMLVFARKSLDTKPA